MHEHAATAREIAAGLGEAARDRAPLPPFTDARPELDAETAYAAQWRLVQERLAGGERLIGAKLGLTSRAKQEAMGVDVPLYGWLTSGMVLEPGTPLPTERFIHPRVEPEIAFQLERELAGPATVVDVLDATATVFAALEVIDSRYDGFRFKLPDVVADNASAAAVLLGPVAVAPERLGDLRLLGCVLRRGGEVVHTAAGAAVMGHPAAAVAWLANRLTEVGRTLPAGSLVLSGGLTDAVPVAPGETITAEFDGLGVVEAFA
jgi:2-oxo-3-hexenedioate decarboxylase